jgi:microcystin-dependent protein
MNPFLAEIRIFAGNFAPLGWAFCNGQILSISQNTALFSLIGTMYGGNGQTNFALPNLQGCAPLHAGQGPGLSPYDQGQRGGATTHTLTVTETPQHGHAFNAAPGGRANNNTISGEAPSTTVTGVNVYAAAANATMNQAMLSPTAPTQPHENRQPFLGVNFIIATQGIFPARN